MWDFPPPFLTDEAMASSPAGLVCARAQHSPAQPKQALQHLAPSLRASTVDAAYVCPDHYALLTHDLHSTLSSTSLVSSGACLEGVPCEGDIAYAKDRLQGTSGGGGTESTRPPKRALSPESRHTVKH